MTTFTTAINPTHSYHTLFNIIKKALMSIIHDVNSLNYEANRLTNGLMYYAEMHPLTNVETISHDWIITNPTIAAILFNSKKNVVAITADLCIVFGVIQENKLVVDMSNIYNCKGIPPAYIFPYDVPLLKVLN